MADQRKLLNKNTSKWPHFINMYNIDTYVQQTQCTMQTMAKVDSPNWNKIGNFDC